jgi:riboflavin biosynthesis pyrimidine reductase
MQSKLLSPWIATSEDADTERQRVLEDAGARVLRFPSDAQGRVHLPSLLEELYARGIGSLMVEGGAGIITSFLCEQLVDQIIVTVAPILVGGMHAVGRLSETGALCLPRLRNLRHQRLDGDMVIWGTPYWEQE